jgi:hypothetical protein
MKKKMMVALAGITLVCGLMACSGGGPDLEEGLWEISTEIDMPGMPMKIPPMVYRQCLTKEDVIPKQGPAEQENCTYSAPKTRGNTVSWSMECDSPGGKTKSEGEITYQGRQFNGTMTMSMTGAVQMSGTNRMTGKRIGECQ